MVDGRGWIKNFGLICLGMSMVSFTPKVLGEIHRSRPQIPLAKGEKWPNSLQEGDVPVVDYAVVYSEDKDSAGGFTGLIPYILPSPDQTDAGSCLYMSHTGIAEWWLNRLHTHPSARFPLKPGGANDLSERYTMNLATLEESSSQMFNWKTDTILSFNKTRKSMSNSHYRYTQGWYKEDARGDYVKAQEDEKGAQYGTPFNWIVEDSIRQSTGPFISLPLFKRTVIFADPESNQWNVGVAPSDIVEKVKAALEEKKAPINVIYNHHGYWHSVIVLGFNDDLSSANCPFVRSHIRSMQKQATHYQDLASKTENEQEKEKYLKRAKNYAQIREKSQNSFDSKGCREQGVFFVRDSIYSDPKELLYDYDLNKKGEEIPYSSRIIHREYEWLEVLANHVIQVYVE